MARVSVVIPNWNGAGRLSALLGELTHQSQPVDRVIVVDNGSTDDSVEVAKRAGASVIELESNTGFSHAVNRGIEAAETEWIVIMNNDVAPQPDWLANLLATADSSGASFATGKLLDATAHQQMEGAFDAICRGACPWRCGNGRWERTCG